MDDKLYLYIYTYRHIKKILILGLLLLFNDYYINCILMNELW